MERGLRFALAAALIMVVVLGTGAYAAYTQGPPPGTPGFPGPRDWGTPQRDASVSGTRDDTATLQRALDTSGKLSLKKLAGGACYQTRGLWVSKNGSTITSPNGACIQYLGPSTDARLQSGDGDPIHADAVFFVNRSSMTAAPPQHITISKLRLVVSSGTDGYGILIAGSDVAVNGVTIEGAPFDGITMTGRANGSACSCASQVQITNNTVSGALRNGVSIASAVGVTIDSNTITGSGSAGSSCVGCTTGPWAGIDLEPDLSFYPITQITISRNTISDNGGAGILLALFGESSGQNWYPAQADQIVLDRNTINHNAWGSGSFLHGGACLAGGQADGKGHLGVTNDTITNNNGYGLCKHPTLGFIEQVSASGNTYSGNTLGASEWGVQ